MFNIYSVHQAHTGGGHTLALQVYTIMKPEHDERDIVGINSEPQSNPSTYPTENKRQNFISKNLLRGFKQQDLLSK